MSTCARAARQSVVSKLRADSSCTPTLGELGEQLIWSNLGWLRRSTLGQIVTSEGVVPTSPKGPFVVDQVWVRPPLALAPVHSQMEAGDEGEFTSMD